MPVMTPEGLGCCSISGGGWNGVVRMGGEGVSKSVMEADADESRRSASKW